MITEGDVDDLDAQLAAAYVDREAADVVDKEKRKRRENQHRAIAREDGRTLRRTGRTFIPTEWSPGQHALWNPSPVIPTASESTYPAQLQTWPAKSSWCGGDT